MTGFDPTPTPSPYLSRPPPRRGTAHSEPSEMSELITGRDLPTFDLSADTKEVAARSLAERMVGAALSHRTSTVFFAGGAREQMLTNRPGTRTRIIHCRAQRHRINRPRAQRAARDRYFRQWRDGRPIWSSRIASWRAWIATI